MKNKLTEILKESFKGANSIGELADKLIDAGVIVPSVKIGDKLYGICGTVNEYTVTNILFYGDEIIVCGSDGRYTDIEICPDHEIGNGEIFRTKAEAKSALKAYKEGLKK